MLPKVGIELSCLIAGTQQRQHLGIGKSKRQIDKRLHVVSQTIDRSHLQIPVRIIARAVGKRSDGGIGWREIDVNRLFPVGVHRGPAVGAMGEGFYRNVVIALPLTAWN